MEPETFDDIMRTIGNNGLFQRRFNVVFNFVLVFLSTLIYMNVIYSLIVPDHWCHVPGVELTNMTGDEWKNYTIPRDESGEHSKCQMYDVAIANGTDKPYILRNNQTLNCQFGWKYDKTWYKRTAPSQEDWVCDRELNVANALAIAKIGEVIGTLIFGQLGDRFGRKKIFFATIVMITFGQSMLTITAHDFTCFLFFMFVGNATTTQLLISPLVISMEISSDDDRTFIATLQKVSWTIALCALPLTMWALGDWVPFMLLTTLPCAVFLLSNRFIVESPRWLAANGAAKRCVGELKRIADVNGTKLPANVGDLIEAIASTSEPVYGAFGLFANWRLAKNTLLITAGWSTAMLTYVVLTLNVSNLGGNPFLNYFWQGLAELPAYIIGKYCCDCLGRRWTNVFAFCCTFVGVAPVVVLIDDADHETLSNVLTVFVKFSTALSLYTIQLQGLEIFPTVVRQTGQSVGLLTSNAAAILAPYVVYLGTTANESLPYVACGSLSVLGATAVFFLPETLDAKLPETLNDAKYFGAEQSYFAWISRRNYSRAARNDFEMKSKCVAS